MDVTNTKTVKTCPVCRKLSYYVIPSNMWYSTKEEKQELIENYKTNCKLIDCKHLDFGNGRCPFGTNCFYKHTVKPGSYTWIHHKPPTPRRPNIVVLNQFNSIMPLPERLGGSVPSDSEDYDDEEMDFFNMASIPVAPGAGSESDTFSSEELDQFEIIPLSERMGGSVPSDSEYYDDEEMDFYNMPVIPEALGACSESGTYSAGSESDTFSSEESDQFEIMPLSEGLGGSVPSDFEDSDDEEMNFFNMAAIPELPGAGSDTFSSEESDYYRIKSCGASIVTRAGRCWFRHL